MNENTNRTPGKGSEQYHWNSPVAGINLLFFDGDADFLRVPVALGGDAASLRLISRRESPRNRDCGLFPVLAAAFI